MTDAVLERARTRESGERGNAVAVARALGRVELGRLAVHPFVAIGAALSALGYFTVLGHGGGQLFNDDAIMGILVFPLAGTTLIATNLCVLRGRRHDVEELFESLPVEETVRTAAHTISVLAPVGYAVLIGIGATVVARISGGIGWPHATEIATGAVLVLSAGLVGILLARVLPRSAAAPFVVIGIGFMEAAMGASDRWQWKHLAPFMPFSDEPKEVWFRPRGAHLVYLLGICIVLFTFATLVRKRSARALVGLITGLAIAVGAAIAQSPVPTAADEPRFAAWIEHPESVQSCRDEQNVEYCAYPDYRELIARWRVPVEGVLALVPESVRARHLLIRQRVPSGLLQTLRPSLKAALSFRLTSQPPFWWPDDGALHPDLHWCDTNSRASRCELVLGNMVASWAVGLPLIRVGPPATEEEKNKESILPTEWINEGLYDSSGQARAVVALWLTIQVTHRNLTPVTPLEETPSLYPISGCSALNDEGPEPAVAWLSRDAGYARRLAERPVADVAGFLRAHWKTVTDPNTTTESLAAMFKIDPPTPEMQRPLALNEGC